ncbi:MAG: xyn10B [Clostridia bacterium]|nr:xyn10B [Clostridia bacterium]
MKKALCLITCMLLILTMTINSFAAQHWIEEATTFATGGTPVIDGKIDGSEWDAATPVTIKLNNDPIVSTYGLYQSEWEGDRVDNDFSTSVKFMWDDKYLYVLEERTDDKVCNVATANEPWTADGMLIFLQVADDDDSRNPDGYSHHIFYTPGTLDDPNKADITLRVCDEATGTRNVIEAAGAQIVSAKTAAGYLVEIAVPWTIFQAEIPAYKGPVTGDKIGLTFVPHDNDNDVAGYQKQLIWVFRPTELLVRDNNVDFGGWGTLVLKEAPAPVVEEVIEVAEDTSDNPGTSDINVLLYILSAVTLFGGISIIKIKKLNK